MNPLVPTPLDVALGLAVTVHVVLAILALIALVRSKEKQGALGSATLIVLVPIVGPIVFLVARRRSRRGIGPIAPETH